MANVTPPKVQDPSDLELILQNKQLSNLEVYLWEPTRNSMLYRRRARGAWRVADKKKTRPEAEAWGPGRAIYYQEEPHDFTTSGFLPIKPDSMWESLPPYSDYPYCKRTRPDDSIAVLDENETRDEGVLCESCAKIPIEKMFLADQSYRLYDGASCLDIDSCRLCRLIFERIKASSHPNDEAIALSVIPADGIHSPRLVIRTGPQRDDQASLAILHRTGSKEYFRLLQKWLHASSGGTEIHPQYLPTRLIHITHSKDGFKLRLVETRRLLRTCFERSDPYIALSHRWGGIDTFCTTVDNFEERLKDIQYSQLPKTFQHAVVTTWNLGVEYLWIDSLCIIQRLAQDWRQESTKMENVFAYAYCTLAATSAKDCNQGFLSRSAEGTIKITDPESNLPLPVYIRETEHDFEKDVAQGPLNKRAWVFQERVLSPRTIHFTAAEAYFECRSNIWCESMGLEHPSETPLQRLQLRLFESEKSSQREESLFETCFSQYSTLDITDFRDRPSAILGLESRLAESYETASLYGILMSSFYNSLFWHRSGGNRMKPIDFPEENVPSWSWMAYEGTVGYGFIPGSFSGSIQFDLPREEDEEIKLTNAGLLAPIHEPGFLLIAPLYQVRGTCVVEPDENSNCKIRDGDKFLGWIRYDNKDQTDGADLLCIRVGQFATDKKDETGSGEMARNDFAPVLLLTPTSRNGKHVYKTYQRLGVGIVRQESLVPDEQGLVWVT
ncbi:hypothetical protein ACHAPT_001391 [Fusarium lateritium]